MQRFRDFLKRKDIEISLRRYGIDALGAMAQGLFCSLLIGTILNTLGQQFHIGFLNAIIFTLGKGDAAVGYTIGGCASLMVGPAMAVAIGYALHAPAMVLFSLVPVGYATNAMGGAGGPLAVLVTAIIAAEFGKAVSKETKVDILVTPIVTILVGIGLAMLVAAPIGKAANWVGTLIMWATEQQPFVMGILVSVIVGIALTLPISSAAICAALSLTGLAGGAAVAGCCANMVGFAVLSFRENGWGGLVSQGLGTSMLQIHIIFILAVIHKARSLLSLYENSHAFVLKSDKLLYPGYDTYLIKLNCLIAVLMNRICQKYTFLILDCMSHRLAGFTRCRIKIEGQFRHNHAIVKTNHCHL